MVAVQAMQAAARTQAVVEVPVEQALAEIEVRQSAASVVMKPIHELSSHLCICHGRFMCVIAVVRSTLMYAGSYIMFQACPDCCQTTSPMQGAADKVLQAKRSGNKGLTGIAVIHCLQPH